MSGRAVNRLEYFSELYYMERVIKKYNSPENLNNNWDNLADFYFQKREFLSHLHKYNPCSQRYYELYRNDNFVAGTIVYTLKIDILTFANIPSPFKVQVIGIPVSVASPPIIGDSGEYEYFLSEIIKTEPGIILGLNFVEDYLKGKVLNLRTLPTIILKLKNDSMVSYENSLRHPYRRRIKRIREKFSNVTSVTSDCSVYNEEHYSLYLQIMKKTTTKLETLSLNLFKYLPANFQLTTYYSDKKMICWHVVCKDNDVLFFFFGGMNYSFCDKFHTYNNNLLGIVSLAIDNNYREIDFGQTAEIAKTRLGGLPSERRMFFYHRNHIIFGILRLLRNLINYSKTFKKPNVFKIDN
jgi:hypothetical protein